jgi:hypothetical protein
MWDRRGNKNKIKYTCMLFWAYNDVMCDAGSSDKDERKYFNSLMFYCNIAWNNHKITLV